MTTPGPDKIIACPQCKALSKMHTIASGNTFGSVLWSDAKMDAPMLPEADQVTRCGQCKTVFWIKNAQVVGEYDWYRSDESDEPARQDWIDAPSITHPDAATLAEAIGTTSDADGIRYLRVKLWHIFNDAFRKELSLIHI